MNKPTPVTGDTAPAARRVAVIVPDLQAQLMGDALKDYHAKAVDYFVKVHRDPNSTGAMKFYARRDLFNANDLLHKVAREMKETGFEGTWLDLMFTDAAYGVNVLNRNAG